MNYTLSEVKGFIDYWTAQPESAQRTVCLKYWVEQAQTFITYSRTTLNLNGEKVMVGNDTETVQQAVRIVAKFFGVPQKKKGENRFTQMMRLTGLTLKEWEGVEYDV